MSLDPAIPHDVDPLVSGVETTQQPMPVEPDVSYTDITKNTSKSDTFSSPDGSLQQFTLMAVVDANSVVNDTDLSTTAKPVATLSRSNTIKRGVGFKKSGDDLAACAVKGDNSEEVLSSTVAPLASYQNGDKLVVALAANASEGTLYVHDGLTLTVAGPNSGMNANSASTFNSLFFSNALGENLDSAHVFKKSLSSQEIDSTSKKMLS